MGTTEVESLGGKIKQEKDLVEESKDVQVMSDNS